MMNTTAKRTDIHRPEVFNPENYTFVGAYDNAWGLSRIGVQDLVAKNREDGLAGHVRYGDGRQCDHCGAVIRYVGLFRHEPTGDVLSVGQVCTSERFPLTKWQFDSLRKAAAAERAEQRILTAWSEFKDSHPEVDWDLLSDTDNSFVKDVLGKGRRYGYLYARQIDALRRVMNDLTTPADAATVVDMTNITFDHARQSTNVRPNRFAGKCHLCAGWVEAEAGTLSKGDTGWLVAHVACPETVTPERQQQALEPGIYMDGEGAIWKVQSNKAKTSVYAKVWVSHSGERLTLGGERTHGEWSYVPGGLRSVVSARRMTLDEAKQFILIYGSCVRCGRTLKAAESVERGIGPVCVTYFEGWGA